MNENQDNLVTADNQCCMNVSQKCVYRIYLFIYFIYDVLELEYFIGHIYAYFLLK